MLGKNNPYSPKKGIQSALLWNKSFEKIFIVVLDDVYFNSFMTEVTIIQ